jgi:predicted alpha-1,6-mannanase (GH76 family)
MGHVGIVRGYGGQDTMITIEGNAARYLCRVAEKTPRDSAMRQHDVHGLVWFLPAE